MSVKPLTLLISILWVMSPRGSFAAPGKIDSLSALSKSGKEDTNVVLKICSLAEKIGLQTNDSLNKIVKAGLDRAWDISAKTDFNYGKALVLYCKGYILRRTKTDTATKYLLSASEINEPLGRPGLAFKINNALSNIYYTSGNYSADAVYAYKNIKIAELLQDSSKLTIAYHQLGNLYSDEHDYARAIKYHCLDLKYELKKHDSLHISYEYVNLGIDYLGASRFDSAIYYSNQAILIQTAAHNEVGQAYSLCTIGEAHFKQGEYQAALEDLLKAENFLTGHSDIMQQVENWNDLGNVYKALKDYGKAGHYFSIAKASAEKNKLYKYLIDSYLGLSQIHELLHDKDSALFYYKLYTDYKDTVFSTEKAKNVLSLSYQYNHDKEEKIREMENKQKEAINASERKSQQLIIASISIGLIMVVIFLGFVLNRFKITRQQKLVIEEQKIIVEEKNKDILDSITYAKRLQDAILPPLATIKRYLPESFVLYKPKDIVAGDFYWMEHFPLPMGEGQGEVTLIAACDCTGHGVPGAMVSVVCSNALNRTVKEFKITESGKILDKVRELVLETFEKSESEVKDGMDVSLCSITPLIEGEGAGVRLQWSGAHNPLWYIQNGELKELAPNKQPIGAFDKPLPFTTVNLELTKGVTIYLFTDGYADQFGGPKGKKFKYKQMQELLLANAAKPVEEQGRILNETLEAWKGTLEQVDDVLIIGIRV
jgi:tetratricopeptide (TPR) repeat protein